MISKLNKLNSDNFYQSWRANYVATYIAMQWKEKQDRQVTKDFLQKFITTWWYCLSHYPIPDPYSGRLTIYHNSFPFIDTFNDAGNLERDQKLESIGVPATNIVDQLVYQNPVGGDMTIITVWCDINAIESKFKTGDYIGAINIIKELRADYEGGLLIAASQIPAFAGLIDTISAWVIYVQNPLDFRNLVIAISKTFLSFVEVGAEIIAWNSEQEKTDFKNIILSIRTTLSIYQATYLLGIDTWEFWESAIGNVWSAYQSITLGNINSQATTSNNELQALKDKLKKEIDGDSPLNWFENDLNKYHIDTLLEPLTI